LIERQPLAEIEAFFEGRGFRLKVDTAAPPTPTAEEIRRMPSIVRKALRDRKRKPPSHWVHLCGLDGTIVARWYGSGDSPEDAIRSAAARWRVEQAV